MAICGSFFFDLKVPCSVLVHKLFSMQTFQIRLYAVAGLRLAVAIPRRWYGRHVMMAKWGVTHQAHLEKGTLVHPFFKAP